MCFGQQQVDQKNTVTNQSGTQNSQASTSALANSANTSASTTQANANPLVSGAVASNLGFVNNLQNAGFQGYGGQQVANFAPMQNASFNMTNDTANNGTAPAATKLINSYSSAPASQVNANTIASQMSPYMNQYVMQALAPQLHQQDVAFGNARAATDAQATGSGAFGDARTGIEQSNNNFNDATAREGLIGNAYNSAFNTAIGAGAQDVSNNLSAQGTNANLNEQYLGRALGGANALQGLQNQQLGVSNAVNTQGQQQTAQQQAQLTAQYNQWLMAQQYPFQTAGLMNSTIGTAANATPATTTTTGANTGATSQVGNTTANQQTQQYGTSNTTETKPDNSGLSFLGTAAGSLLGNSGFGTAMGTAVFSDKDLKEDIVQVGTMKDGTPIYTYRYFDDPENVTRIGLMAQDVEKTNPDAVIEAWPGGAKMVDYGKASALSRALALKEAA